jgi:hypothetical protein
LPTRQPHPPTPLPFRNRAHSRRTIHRTFAPPPAYPTQVYTQVKARGQPLSLPSSTAAPDEPHGCSGGCPLGGICGPHTQVLAPLGMLCSLRTCPCTRAAQGASVTGLPFWVRWCVWRRRQLWWGNSAKGPVVHLESLFRWASPVGASTVAVFLVYLVFLVFGAVR